MTWAFRSVGSTGSAFNTTMTPGAPAGFQAGDFLALAAFCVPKTITSPDLTASGFVQLSKSSPTTNFTSCVIYGKIAVGNDTMPTFQMGTDFQACFCSAYSGAPASITGIASQTGVERAITTTSGISFSGYSAPPDDNVLILGLSVRGYGSATGVTFGASTPFTTRATYLTNSRPHGIFMDLIQTTAAAGSLFNISTSPADSTSLPALGELVFLKSGVSSSVPFPPTSLGGMNVQVCM